MNYPINLDTVFTFGKHKGKFLWEILEDDPSYIVWCMDNIPDFELDNESFEEYQQYVEE